MSAPLPEVPPLAPRQSAKPAPLSLSVMVGLGIILAALSIIFYTPSLDEIGISVTVERVLIGVFLLVYIVPLVSLWFGLGWARWVMMVLIVGSYALSLLGGEEPPQTNAQEILDRVYYIYDASLLLFLWTPAMRAHFAPREKTKQ